MPITRKYLCDECGWEFTVLHWDRDDPVPACPACSSSAKNIPGSFAIKTNASRAGDMAYRMAEESYGITDANDNLKEGDSFMKAPAPVQTAEAEQLTRAMKEAMPELTDQQAKGVNDFWVKGMAPEQSQAMDAQAQQGAALARAGGDDPMALLHQGQKETGGSMGLEVVGRAKIDDVA